MLEALELVKSVEKALKKVFGMEGDRIIDIMLRDQHGQEVLIESNMGMSLVQT